MNDVMILGAGAVGCLVGGHLAAQGYSVELVNRSAATSEAIAKRGLLMELDAGNQTVQLSAAQLDSASDARFVMLFTKAYQTQAALNAVLPKLSPEAVIVTLQNGLGNAERLAELSGREVLQGVTLIPSTLVAPGHVRSHGAHTSWLGPLDLQNAKQQAAGQELAQMLNASGLTTEYESEVRTRVWHKACFNVAMNGICALADAPPGLVYRTPQLMSQAHALADEGIAVAHAEGAMVDAGALHTMIDFAAQEHTYHQPSMLQDVRADRETEIESLNGYIVAAAARHNISVPRNELIYGLVLARQASSAFWANQPKG